LSTHDVDMKNRKSIIIKTDLIILAPNVDGLLPGWLLCYVGPAVKPG